MPQIDATERARLLRLPILKSHAFNFTGWAMEEMPKRSFHEIIYDIGRIDAKTGCASELDVGTGVEGRKVNLATAMTLSENKELGVIQKEYLVVGYLPRDYKAEYRTRAKISPEGYPVGTSLGAPSEILRRHPDRPPIIIVADVAICLGLKDVNRPLHLIKLWEVNKEEDGELTLQNMRYFNTEVFFRWEFRTKGLQEYDRLEGWGKEICNSAEKHSGKLYRRVGKNVLKDMHFRMTWPEPWVRKLEPDHEVSKTVLEKVLVAKATGVVVGLKLAGTAPLLSEGLDELDPADEDEQADMDEGEGDENSEVSDASDSDDDQTNKDR